MKTLTILSLASSLLLLVTSCAAKNYPNQMRAAAAVTKAATQMPTSLNGTTLQLTSRKATTYRCGSAGMNAALQSKFLNLNPQKWQPSPAPEGAISFKSIAFSGNRWNAGEVGGPCTFEVVGKNKLFVTLLPDEDALARGEDDKTIYMSISLLLDFSTGNFGTAIWGEEESFTGNIRFLIENPAQVVQANLAAPTVENGTLLEITGTGVNLYTYIYIHGGQAYATVTNSPLKQKPVLVRATDYFRPGGLDRYGHQVWFDKNDPSYTAKSPEGNVWWYACQQFSYVPQGSKGSIYLSYARERCYESVCLSARKGKGVCDGYAFDAVPAEFVITGFNGNVYEGIMKGVAGAKSGNEQYGFPQDGAPYPLAKIRIIK